VRKKATYTLARTAWEKGWEWKKIL